MPKCTRPADTTAGKFVASHSGTLGLRMLFGVKADRKFPVLKVTADLGGGWGGKWWK